MKSPGLFDKFIGPSEGHVSLCELFYQAFGLGSVLLMLTTLFLDNLCCLNGFQFGVLGTSTLLSAGLTFLILAFAPKSTYTALRSHKAGIVGMIVMALISLIMIPMNGLEDGAFAATVLVMAGAWFGIALVMAALDWAVIFSDMFLPDIVTVTVTAVIVAFVPYAFIITKVPSYLGVFLTTAALLVGTFFLYRMIVIRRDDVITTDFPTFNEKRERWGRYVSKIGLPFMCSGMVLAVFLEHARYVMIPKQSLLQTLNFVVMLLVALAIIEIGVAGVRRGRQAFTLILTFAIPLVFIVSMPLGLPSAGALVSQEHFSLIAALTIIITLSWSVLESMSLEYRLNPVSVCGIGLGSLAIGMLLMPVDALRQLNGFENGTSVLSIIEGLLCLLMAIGYLPKRAATNLTRTTLLGSTDQPRQRCQGCTLVIQGADDGESTTIAQTAAEKGGAYPANFSATRANTEAADPQSMRTEPEPRKSYSDETASSASRKGRFRRRCEQVAARYQLSDRETDVFMLLAKGRNKNHIMEELVISEGTAKTHIGHVYKKLNVHSRHELIDLIESTDVEFEDWE